MPGKRRVFLEKEMIRRRLEKRRIVQDNGCWEFTGAINRYGVMGIEGKNYYTHRLAAWIWKGLDLASELVVMHSCDNQKCFNPQHLMIGTQGDNLRDASLKGRTVCWGRTRGR